MDAESKMLYKHKFGIVEIIDDRALNSCLTVEQVSSTLFDCCKSTQKSSRCTINRHSDRKKYRFEWVPTIWSAIVPKCACLKSDGTKQNLSQKPKFAKIQQFKLESASKTVMLRCNVLSSVACIRTTLLNGKSDAVKLEYGWWDNDVKYFAHSK